MKELAKRLFLWRPVGYPIMAAVRGKYASSSAACGENRAQESWQWFDPVEE